MPKYINKLEGKRVLIVGGTSGIGFGVAEACVEYGAIVTVASSQQTKVTAAVDRLKAAYPESADKITGKTCDLSADNMEENIKNLYDFATSNGAHKLDHVVDTAGDLHNMNQKLAAVTYTPDPKYGRVRYFGPMMLAKYALEYMNSSPESSFTLTSGVMAHKPREGLSAIIGLASAKECMSRALAVDMKPIRVNTVSPGAIKTEMWDMFGDEKAVAGMIQLFKSKTLTGTIGLPEDTAESYLYCMKNHFLTGRTLHAEGGFLLV
ncbi:hypothetical protein TWF694_003535 [Orbilia ellipsospora]|uniref:Uncharacterized protein n=1 Tax=Orbilia ellipsospora TaxID=2528407 RepID=A0AAV9WYH5_9PEZI